MVKLFGKDKNSEESDSQHGEPVPHQPEPDERTRLLPPQPREPFLSPDDPAVSPYNLFSVRVVRSFTVLFLAITFLWWTLLFVSIFVSPPGMHSRGSGFFDVAYSTLTLGNLILALLFFTTPSKATQSVHLVLAAILLVNMILIVSVTQIREEEGWVGIVSVVWALLIALWTVFSDRFVAWGKQEEEERLTGRMETRRTVTEWLSVLVSIVVLVILAIVAILISATLILRSRDASLAPMGQKYFVDSGKYQIHLYCHGNKTDANGDKLPTVLFEAGEEPFEQNFLAFAQGTVQNRSISRFCYADRPGFAWSDNAPSPFSAGMATDVLSEALAQAGETGPWILVSAGVGSIYSRIFSARHGRDVAGMLLVDPLHENLLSGLGAPKHGFVLWGRGFISPLGLRRIPGALFHGRTREDRVYGSVAYQSGKYIKAKLQESLVADSLTRSEVSSARTIQDQSVPLVVVSSGENIRQSRTWERMQRDLTTLTGALKAWDIVDSAPHEVFTDRSGRDRIEKRLRQLVAGAR